MEKEHEENIWRMKNIFFDEKKKEENIWRGEKIVAEDKKRKERKENIWRRNITYWEKKGELIGLTMI